MTPEYIEKQTAIDALGEAPEVWTGSDVETSSLFQWERDKAAIEAVPSADVQPVVRCWDCKFWHDAYVKQNDGTKRKYRETDVDPLGIKNSVTLDKGINCGAMCCVEDGKGWGINKRVFRQADDFCSRGKLRPCSYDEWWGIVDGVYPEENKP